MSASHNGPAPADDAAFQTFGRYIAAGFMDYDQSLEMLIAAAVAQPHADHADVLAERVVGRLDEAIKKAERGAADKQSEPPGTGVPDADPEPDNLNDGIYGQDRGEMHGRLRVYGVDDIDTAPPRDYLLKGIISPGEISLWVGPPKCGKSFLMLYISYLLSLGRTIFGRRVKACSVLYVAAEGEAGIANRIRVLRDKYGPSPNFHFIAQPADLLHREGHLGDLIKAVDHYKAKLVPLDTLSRLFAGGDENSSADMGCFIKNVTQLRFETGAHIAVIHHGTKSSSGLAPRGHGSLEGADDALIEVVKDQLTGNRTATLVHAKDDPDGVCLPFRLAPVVLGVDDDGDAVTTLLTQETEPSAPPSPVKLSDSEKLAMRAFDTAVSKREPSGPSFAIDIEDWRKEFYATCEPGEKQEAKRQAFKRACKSLLEKDVIATENDLVWRLAPPTRG